MTTLSLIRRDDVNLKVTFTDIEGNPFDLTDCIVFFTMKEKPTDSDEDAIIAKEVTEHDEPEQGITRIPLTKEETDVTPKYYFYDLQIEDEDGIVLSSEAGRIKITQDITVRTNDLS